MLCSQQGVSGRISTRISAIESVQNEFKLQLSEVMQTVQSNQQQTSVYLKNLSSMVSSMMEKIGQVQTVCDPKSPPAQITNSLMPSLEPMLNSGAGSAGDTTHNPSSKVVGTEDATHATRAKGDSEVGASNVGATVAKPSPGGGVVEDGDLGGVGNRGAAVGEPMPIEAGKGKGVSNIIAKGAESGSKIEGSGDGGSGTAVAVEGGSGGSGNGDEMITPSGKVDMAQPLSPAKRGTPTKRKRKLKNHSPTKVGNSGSQEAHASDQVSSDIKANGPHSPPKLLIFNVHGTLLDCSLLSSPNPNTSIRWTTRSLTRRIVFRPWLIEFIGKCFKNFRVAFWGIKSMSNMEDVVAEMMRELSGPSSHKPVFCWSAKDCEEVSSHSGASKWKKPLSKVWGMWPEFHEGNTLIIDHMAALVDCNPVENIIIPPSFYVDSMTTLGDDNNYLRLHLWPLLKGLVRSLDVHQCRNRLPNNKQAIGDHARNLHAEGRTTRSSKMKQPAIKLSGQPEVSGEGTCELLVHIAQCPLTIVGHKFTNAICMLGTCAGKSREGATNADAESTRELGE